MIKKILVTIALVFTVLTVGAVPAKKGLTRTLALADGTTVQAWLVGDEHMHYWQTDDGQRFVKKSDGTYEKADLEQMRLVAKNRRAQIKTKHRMPRRVTMGEQTHYTGKKKGIVILMQFTDTKFKTANNQAKYNDILNKEGYNTGNFKGSVADYFKAQSGGIFELEFDVVGPYTADHEQAYYGGNDSNGDDLRPRDLIKEAVNAANAEVNFKDYDWDGDNEVDQVFVLYAGKGEADSYDDDAIWPHMWVLGSPVWLDGVKVQTYACSNEIDNSGNIEGIGCFCHEFSHCMGYPDFYDTSYSGWFGMGSWDLMDAGSYNGNTFQPAGYSAYEKWMAGWIEPIELNTGKVVVENLKSISEGGEGYIIYNDGHKDEYYMVENRQKKNWDASLPGKGLMITHVDFDKDIWEQNSPNTEIGANSTEVLYYGYKPNDHQRFTIFHADKTASTNNMSTDLYPYGSNNSLTNSSNPSASLYNKNTDGSNFMNKSVTEIKQNSNGTMSFVFKGSSNVSKPTFSPDAGTYTEPLDVTISAGSGATIYYTTDGSDPDVAGNVYSGPIHIETTTTLKAVAVVGDEESDVTTAQYVIMVPTGNGDYIRVMNTSQLTEDASYYIVYEASSTSGAAFAGINTSSSTHYGKKTDISIDGYTTTSTEAHALSLKHISGNLWYIMDGEQYIYYKGSGNSLDYTSEKDNAGTLWEITMDGITNYAYSVQNRRLQYNPANNALRFACYTGTQKDVVLYKKDGVLTHLTDPALSFSVTELTALPHQSEFEEPALTNPYNVYVLYSSNNQSVAQVDDLTGNVTIGEEGTATIKASFGGDDTYAAGSASYTITVSRKDAELSYSVTEVHAAPNTENFTAPTLSNPHGLTVGYSSDKPKVAAVNAETGEVTIGTSGKAVITASFAGNDEYKPASVSYTITVEQTEGYLAYDISEIITTVGKTDIDPPTLINPYALPVVFTSSDEKVVYVDDTSGFITIGKAGTATITASFAGNEEYTAVSASYKVTVNKMEADLSFDPTEVTVEAETADFEEPVLTNPHELAVTYASSDETLATVNAETGEVTIGSEEGTVTITATFAGNEDCNEGSASYTIVITPKPIVKQEAGLSFDPTEVTVETETADFEEPVLNNPNQLEVVFSSSDETLATVDAESGEVTIGDTEGTVVITATFAGNDYFNEGSASYTIVITPKPIIKQEADLSFDSTEVTVEAETEDFTEPVLNNPNQLEVVYSSSDETLATVNSESGEVTIGTTPGTVVITATFAGNDYFLEGSASYTIIITERADVGIRMLQALVAEGHDIFDLQGRKVNVTSLPKGLYICNGRKFVVQ